MQHKQVSFFVLSFPDFSERLFVSLVVNSLVGRFSGSNGSGLKQMYLLFGSNLSRSHIPGSHVSSESFDIVPEFVFILMI